MALHHAGLPFATVPTVIRGLTNHTPGNAMRLMNIIYVSDMPRAVDFYEAIGLQRAAGGEADPMWNEFDIGDARVALHAMDADQIPTPSKHLEFHLQVPGDELERLHTTCTEAGHPVSGPIQDIGFGRFFWVTDPDGLWVQFNEEAR